MNLLSIRNLFSNRLVTRKRRYSPTSPESLEPRALLVTPQQIDDGLLGEGVASTGSTLFFEKDDEIHGNELWKTDGTPGGTSLVRDITPGVTGTVLDASNWQVANGMLFFSIESPSFTKELWRSDGTEAGTVKVDDLNGGLNDFIAFENTIYFSGLTSVTQNNQSVTVGALKQTSGSGSTVISNHLVAITNPPFPQEIYYFSGVSDFGVINDELYFNWITQLQNTSVGGYAKVPAGGQTVVRLDDSLMTQHWNSQVFWGDTILGRTNHGDILQVNLLGAGGDSDSGHEPGLISASGAPEIIVNINPGAESSFGRYQGASVNGWYYFNADDGTHGEELWRTDGTANGTSLVADLYPGSRGSFPNGFIALGDKILFATYEWVAPDSGQYSAARYWSVDTTNNEVTLLHSFANTDLMSSNNTYHDLKRPVVSNGVVYFAAEDLGENKQNQIWRSDGTPAGTFSVTNFGSGDNQGFYSALTKHGNDVYWLSQQTGLWKFDTTPNQAPTLAAATFSIAENSPNTTQIGQLISGDPNASDELHFQIVDGDADNTFQVNSFGQILVADSTLLNYEHKQSYTLTVRVEDDGLPRMHADATITINITDINEAPTGVIFQNAIETIDDRTFLSERLKVADLIITDDAMGDETYLLSGTDAESFEIVGQALYLKADTSVDYRMKSSYSVTVSADDSTVGNTPDAATVLNMSVVATDIRMTSAITDPVNSTIALSYTIDHLDSMPFLVEFRTSTDEIFSQDDLLISQVLISEPEDLTVGSHVLLLSIDGMTGVQLPGTLPFSNLAPNEQVLVVADSFDGISEPDADPFAEDNTTLASGLYLTDSKLYFLGSASDDDLVVTRLNSILHVTWNGAPVDFSDSLFNEFYLYGGSGNDTISLNGIDRSGHLFGGFGNDSLTGGSLADRMYGGLGDDVMSGGNGDDFYWFEQASSVELDSVNEFTNGGIDALRFDSIETSVVVNLGSSLVQNVHENRQVKLNSSAQFENLSGGRNNDTLTGNSLRNSITGGDGDDVINGGIGHDNLTGGKGNDTLVGGSGNDELTGEAGDDTMNGGENDDTYFLRDGALFNTDFLNENSGQGTDTLNFSGVTTAVVVNLGSSISQNAFLNQAIKLNSASVFENATGGTGNDTLTGNSLENSLSGLDGNDRLAGGTASDVLVGGNGDDTYLFNTASALESDTLTELSGQGTDTLSFSALTTAVELSLAKSTIQSVDANRRILLSSSETFENLQGGSANDILTGNSLANVLIGNAGNDTLTGADGNDAVAGGAGDDTYVFHVGSLAEADTLTELVGQGTDTLNFSTLAATVNVNLGTALVQSVHANRTLKLNSSATFENVRGGSGDDVLTGNSLANVLTGNSGSDTLTGAGNSDILAGGIGDDTYLFNATTDAELDSLTELSGQGTDTLSFSTLSTAVTVSLGTSLSQSAHINRTLKLNSSTTFENVRGGSGADVLTGNSLSNILTGNSGSDTLTGAGGSDVLSGGIGDDTYLFNAAVLAESDTLTELVGQGNDTISFSSLTSPLVANLGTILTQSVHVNRTLKLSSSATFENLTGGAADDILTGNSGNNSLLGNGGNDIIVGAAGNDSLLGGTGRDVLIGGLGLDTIDGGSDDDILIAGRSTNENSLVSLGTIREEWAAATTYTARVTTLRTGVGSPAVSLKVNVNVLNDAGEIDLLTGGSGKDWFLKALDDTILDLIAGELTDVI